MFASSHQLRTELTYIRKSLEMAQWMGGAVSLSVRGVCWACLPGLWMLTCWLKEASRAEHGGLSLSPQHLSTGSGAQSRLVYSEFQDSLVGGLRLRFQQKPTPQTKITTTKRKQSTPNPNQQTKDRILVNVWIPDCRLAILKVKLKFWVIHFFVSIQSISELLACSGITTVTDYNAN